MKQEDFYIAYKEQGDLKKVTEMFIHNMYDEDRNDITIEIYIPNNLLFIDKSNIKQFKNIIIRHASSMYQANVEELTTMIKFEGKNRTITISSFLFNNIALNDKHYKVTMK